MFLISPNAGPSPLAGKGCSPFFFSTSYQNDQPPEVLGKYAQDKGYKKAFLLAPNYQAGKDMIGGFKKHFKGEIADEVYTPLGQLDFSAELAKIASRQARRLLRLHARRHGREPRQAIPSGRTRRPFPFLSVFTVDESTLPAQQDAAVGFLLRHDLGAQYRHAREQEVRCGLREGVWLCARAATPCRPMTPRN